MMKGLVRSAALLAAALACPALAQAQIRTVDPDSGVNWQRPSGSQIPSDQVPIPTDSMPADPLPPASPDDWTPVDSSPDVGEPAAPGFNPPGTQTAPGSPDFAERAQRDAATVPRDDVLAAAEGVFGRGAAGLAGIIEDILGDQGEPVAYIAGREAAGAFILGARYGSGTMHHRTGGDSTVYWRGPSIGFDVGADASKVFVLVYNLNDPQQLFRRYLGGEGRAYFVGGFTATYLRRGDVVLIPVRLGVGLRLGVNASCMRFSQRNRWFPSC